MISYEHIDDLLFKKYPIYKKTVTKCEKQISESHEDKEWMYMMKYLQHYKARWYKKLIEERINETNLDQKYVIPISMRYGFDDEVFRTYEEIGEEMNIFRHQARQLEITGMRILFQEGKFLKKTMTIEGKKARLFQYLKDSQIVKIMIEEINIEEEE
jgi:DNA-directed RNA polymerase sigma subunit (sigma70/sigma32)